MDGEKFAMGGGWLLDLEELSDDGDGEEGAVGGKADLDIWGLKEMQWRTTWWRRLMKRVREE